MTEDPRIGRRALAEQAARRRRRYWDLYAAVMRGALPAVRVGGRWFVSDADVDAFLDGAESTGERAS